MNDKHSIKLYLQNDVWMAKHSEPSILELFETDVLPTAYRAGTDKLEVLENICRLNPDKNVVLGKGPIIHRYSYK